MPSSMSVGATESAKSTTNLANCFTLIIYFGSSESALMIFVHLATCKNQNIVCRWQTGKIICCTLPLMSTVPAMTGYLVNQLGCKRCHVKMWSSCKNRY